MGVISGAIESNIQVAKTRRKWLTGSLDKYAAIIRVGVVDTTGKYELVIIRSMWHVGTRQEINDVEILTICREGGVGYNRPIHYGRYRAQAPRSGVVVVGVWSVA